MVIKNPQYKSLAIKSLCHALLNDTDCDVRCNAAEALGKMGDEEAVPILAKALQDKNSLVRQKVAESLGKISNYDYLSELSLFKEFSQVIRNMSEQPKSQVFHFNSINGNVNAGGTVTDQNYSHNNYLNDPRFIETLEEIKNFLDSLPKNDTKTSDLTIDIIECEFQELQQKDLNKWKRWMTWLDVAFAGGIESAKVLNPWVGIPIEVVKKLYQVYCESQKNSVVKKQA